MDFLSLIFYFIVIIPSSIIHEYAHGWMAERLGDPTARYAGRMTLDPRAHIDLWGTLLLPLMLFITTGGRFMFAYAKPVPYNPYNLRNQKWGPALVGFAGPASNFLMAAAFAVVIRLVIAFNVVVLLPLIQYIAIIVYANVLLMIFNLVPIPPLDGSKLLYALFPNSLQGLKNILDRYGFVVLIFFVLFLSQLISPIIQAVFNVLVG